MFDHIDDELNLASERMAAAADSGPRPAPTVEWDAMTLDQKLQTLAWDVDLSIADDLPAKDVKRLLRASARLEDLNNYVFEWMKKTGHTL